MKKLNKKHIAIGAALLALACTGYVTLAPRAPHAATTTMAAPLAPSRSNALTVTIIQPVRVDWPTLTAASGNIMAWQEASVGGELGGLRLAEVLVNVGDVVQRGQLLARFASDSVRADLALQQAAVEEASAALFEADANAQRAKVLDNSGALSAQQTLQIQVAERSAQARLASARARLSSEQIRLRQTELLAPDDGVVSARSASVGAVTQPGQELFKLIRRSQLEWRAEVAASELGAIRPGQSVNLLAANGAHVQGKVRMLAPTVDLATRNAIAYVDLPRGAPVHAGMFASGQFERGHAAALTVPGTALVVRDGYSYAYLLGAGNTVRETRVQTGRRVEGMVELLDGVTPASQVVAQGAGLLADGDAVKVVAAGAVGAALATNR